MGASDGIKYGKIGFIVKMSKDLKEVLGGLPDI